MIKVHIGSDHGGFALKSQIIECLNHGFMGAVWRYDDDGGVIRRDGVFEVIDHGCHSGDSVDYPRYAARVCGSMIEGGLVKDCGILVCGSGIGMSIVANRFKGIRAALCMNPEMAELSRRHNDSNVLVLGARLIDQYDAIEILKIWLTTEFDGGRHAKRIEKIDSMTGDMMARW